MKHFERLDDSTETVQFDSLDELVTTALIDAKASNPINQGFLKSRHDGFHGRDTYANDYTPKRIIAELQSPPQAAAKVSGLLGDITENWTCETRQRKLLHRQEFGDELDENSWIRRDPDGWRRIAKIPTTHRVIRIACNCAISANRRPDELWYRGAAVAALCDALESRGYRCEIVGFNSVDSLYAYSRVSTYSVLQYTAKRADMPCDLPTLALALAEIGFYRVGIIQAQIACGARQVAHHCGYPAALPPSLAKDFDIVFDSNIFTLSDAIAVVRNYAEQFTTKM